MSKCIARDIYSEAVWTVDSLMAGSHPLFQEQRIVRGLRVLLEKNRGGGLLADSNKTIVFLLFFFFSVLSVLINDDEDDDDDDEQ